MAEEQRGEPPRPPDDGDQPREGGARDTGRKPAAGSSAKRAAGAKKASGAAKKSAAEKTGAGEPAAGTSRPRRKRAPRDAAGAGSAGTTGAQSSRGDAGTGPAKSPGAAAGQTAATSSRRVPRMPAVEGAAARDVRTGGGTGPAAAVPGGSSVSRAFAPVGRVLTSRRAPRLRTGISAFLVVAAVLAVLVGTLALWSRSIVFDTDAYVRVVAPVAENPEVRRAVSDYVAARAVEATDLEARIEDALPSDSKVLAPALTSSLQRFLVDEINEFLGTDLALRLWVDINRFAHEQLIAALQDENRYVTVGRNDVKLNLLPIVAVALQRLEDRIPQLLGRDVTLPEIDPATAPDDIKTLLQDALGRELPAGFGTITLLSGSQGYEAKQALRLFNDLVILVVILTAVLVAAAVLVSVRRWRTALWLGIGSLLAVIAARVIEVQLQEAVAGAVKTQGGAAVARSVLNSAIGSLNGFFAWVALAGAVVAVAAFLAGRPSWLEAIGRGVSQLFGVASDLSTPDTRAGRWMAGHVDLLRVGGVAVALVALLFATASLTAVLLVVLALGVYELALTAYAAGVPRDLDEGPAEEPPAPPAD